MRNRVIILACAMAMGWMACSCGSGANASTAEATTAAEDAESAAPTFVADSAFAYVEAQVAMGPRVPGSDGHSACADYLAASLQRFGADTVMEQRGTVTAFNGDRLPYRNIMGRFNADASRRVLLLAHWDTRPWADNDPDPALRDTPIDGANDGGSGVGVLLEVARLLGQSTPEVGVDILFVDAEDYGRPSTEESPDEDNTWCLGTQEWVKQMPYDRLHLPDYAILLDMVGGRGARFHREPISAYYAGPVLQRVWTMAAASGYDQIFVNEEGSAVVDDHLFLNQAGIPTIDIIESRNAATGSFPATWHTHADNLSNIDPASLKAVGQTIVNLLYQK